MEIKLTHTPGPWESSELSAYTVQGPNGQYVAQAIGRDPVERLANECLIAAAPELLDLVKFLKRWCDENSSISPSMLTSSDETLKVLIDRVIAKAEGK